MSGFVVDASVAVKWVLDEPHSEQAAKLLTNPSLFAPDYWLAEAINAVWARVFRNLLMAEEAQGKAAVLLRSPIRSVALPDLVSEALSLALQHGITVYDALYLALAIARRLPMVTDDRKFVRKLQAGGLGRETVVWVAEL